MEDVDILLIEDNSGDVALIKQTFEEKELPGTVHAVQTGDEALDWLYQRGDFGGAPRPDLVLLDLNLPATSGHTVLEEIKSDTTLKRIPVIVLTGTRAENDLIRAYEEYANACLIKPVDPEEFAELLQTTMDFWVTTATFPSL